MSQTTYSCYIEIDDDAATGLTVYLSDATGAYGVKRNDTDAVVVADGTAMSEIGSGWYSYTWTDPAYDLTYTVAVEYTYDGETTRFSDTISGATSASGAATPARRWESIIPYEDRSNFHTARWRLLGVTTKENAQNTDNGVLWLKMSKAGDTVTANIYKNDGLASGNLVATGSADVSGVDGTGENAAQVTLSEANSSGLSGEFWIHQYVDDDSCPIQVALCTDEDLDVLWDGIEDLSGYDSTYGMAEFIRAAGQDVLALVARLFQDQVGGYGAAEAWYITDAEQIVPDLRRIANPGQLRLACAYRALQIGVGRDHQAAGETAYSDLRDHFADEYTRAMNSLSIALTSGGSAAETIGQTRYRRLHRA